MSAAPSVGRVRTRFAPSPTGYLHLGGARTALFAWAYARHHGGDFVLRIEDTDRERSTQAAVDAILEGMRWLGLTWDEGPFYQTERLERYKAVVQQLLERGQAYPCYCSPAELEAMRERQRQAGEKPRYDGTWRPEPAKVLPAPPEGVRPVVRFRNPEGGSVVWKDLVKGLIEIRNEELDDLIIARPDGVPTYNFCVVVDDMDMGITHVIRGDDHVNNTPRQINIFRALGAAVPQFAHLPMILGPDGEKLSKRHGAVSVIQYDEEGYLPEAMLNYLARLGWGHGDQEIFSLEQFVAWFELGDISPSASRFDFDKLGWLNSHYLREAGAERLMAWLKPRIVAAGGTLEGRAPLGEVLKLIKDRAQTLQGLVPQAMLFYGEPAPDADQLAPMLTPATRLALEDLLSRLAGVAWEAPAIAATFKDVLKTHGLKMPQLAMPVRLALTGSTQTPAIDAVLTLMGREPSLGRLAGLPAWQSPKEQ